MMLGRSWGGLEGVLWVEEMEEGMGEVFVGYVFIRW